MVISQLIEITVISITEFYYCFFQGEQYILGKLRARGIYIQRSRYRNLKPPFRVRHRRPIERRRYRNRGPLNTVHCDGNHERIKYCVEILWNFIHKVDNILVSGGVSSFMVELMVIQDLLLWLDCLIIIVLKRFLSISSKALKNMDSHIE